jgi:hypothetical protein
MRKQFVAGTNIAAILLLIFLASSFPLRAESQVFIRGEIAGIDHNEHTIFVADKGRILPVEFTVDSQLSRDGLALSFSDLTVGDRVEVQYNSETKIASRAIAIDALAVGFITSIAGTTASGNLPITITPQRGKPVNLKIISSTIIERDGKRATAADLKIGDFARAYYNIRTMTIYRLQAYPATKLSANGTSLIVKGIIHSLQWSAEVVPMLMMDVKISKKDQIVRFKVGPKVVVEINGVRLSREALSVEDLATITINRFNNQVTKISVHREVIPVRFNGQIVQKFVGGDFQPVFMIEVQLWNGKRMQLEIIKNTKLTRQNQPATFHDLAVGDRVSGLYEPLNMTLIQLAAFSQR